MSTGKGRELGPQCDKVRTLVGKGRCAKRQDAKYRGRLDARILREEGGHLEMCMNVGACSRVGQVPACSKPPLRGFRLWQPLPHPTHGRRIAVPGGLLVGLHRVMGVAPRSESLDDGWRQWFACRTAGRRRLDATACPPISTRAGCDLLPAASAGAPDGCSHSASLRRARW